MKLRLIVASGPGTGKTVPIAVSPFLIGRNPVCQLRPASPFVSNRHCTLWLRGSAAFVQDMGSTNGTMVNGERIAGERELRDGDRLQVGPLVFHVRIEAALAVDQPTPLPPDKDRPRTPAPDDAAAMILLEGSGEPASSGTVDTAGVPIGDTKLAVPAPNQDKDPKAGKDQKSTEDTSTAANAILKQYLRRPKKR
jgi:pSer/pThr/pTyr-binding forkhead associated (FHA) protein